MAVGAVLSWSWALWLTGRVARLGQPEESRHAIVLVLLIAAEGGAQKLAERLVAIDWDEWRAGQSR